MKKTLIIILSLIAIVGMSACSNDNNKFATKQPDESELNFTNEALEDHPDEDENINRDELPERKQDEETEGRDNEIPEEIVDLEETTIITEYIDLSKITAHVQTDNRNNRVIIFSDDSNEERYKSIFVKRQNRMKIIDLKNDVQIFNEII